MLLTFPLMAAIQEISARIGRTTGHGIAGNLRRHYSDWLLYPIVGLLFQCKYATRHCLPPVTQEC